MKATDSQTRRSFGLGNEFLENLIDTYELFADIFKELGRQNNFTVQLDKTLPFINGREELVKKILFLFVSDIVESHGRDWKSDFLFVSHREESNCWVFNFHPLSQGVSDNNWKKNELKNSQLSDIPFSLLIPKSAIRDSFKNSDISKL